MYNLSQLEIAYLAGIMDGEGCVSIMKSKPLSNTSSPSHILRITIANTNKDLIDWLGVKMGGCTRRASRANYPSAWKDSWQWHIEGFKAMEFLCLVEPYLIIKKAQASIGIEFQKKKTLSTGKRLEKEEILFRDSFRNRLTTLNKKGKDVLVTTYPQG